MPLPAAPTKRADTINNINRNDRIDAAANGSDRKADTRTQGRDEGKSKGAQLHPVGKGDGDGYAAPAPLTKSAEARPTTRARQSGASASLALVEAPPTRARTPGSAGSRQSRNSRTTPAVKKLFVLDTNVLMHDPMCLFHFAEHDIYLPMIVLEELDGNKKGVTDGARNARQISRTLEQLVSAKTNKIRTAGEEGIALNATGHSQAKGKLYFQTEVLDTSLPLSLPVGKADNQILAVAQALGKHHAERPVVLVTNDINMRIKARALGLPVEDYANDKALDDADLLYTGHIQLPGNFWDKHSRNMESWKEGGATMYRVHGPLAASLHINQFAHMAPAGERPFMARVVGIRGDAAVLQTIKDYGVAKNAVFGVNARNKEQNFAMNLLMDKAVDFVTLAGTAGSGKTLMALAAGLSQVIEHRLYSEIIMTRATVSVGEDIGFLPGTEEEKMGPWMGALDDNLEFLSTVDHTGAGEWGRARQSEMLKDKIKVKSMNFMRGRTFLNRYVIVDEAQNLTPKQMKTLITRAGPGTKIICMGNLAQIDTPYLTEGSSGLTFAVDRFKGWPHGGHITLQRGERSRLADFASEVL